MSTPGPNEQIQLRCCVPVTTREIDHERLVQVKTIRWNETYNRGYCTKSCNRHNRTAMHTYWEGRLASSPERFPYFVPSTWYRLSLYVDSTVLPDWGPHWHTLYHGTHPKRIDKIIKDGFRVRTCQHGFPALYVSPSIHYSSHPRYARVILQEGFYFQFILEVRVDVRKLLPIKKRETLEVGVKGDIDPNFPNNQDLEYLFRPSEGLFIEGQHGLVVTGLMVRKLNFDPALLRSSWWWCKWRNWMEIHHFYYNGVPQEEYPTK